MTLPVTAGDMPPAQVDPFGLWQPARAPSAGGEFSFDVGAAPEAAVWQLDLTSDPRTGEAELLRRAGQLEAIESGLNSANARVETLLALRAEARAGGEEISFDASSGAPAPAWTAVLADEPEKRVAQALDFLEAAGGPMQVSFGRGLEPGADGESEAGEVNYGLREDLGRLAGQVKERLTGAQNIAIPDWGNMQRSLEALFDSVNRQLLHYAWVDTRLDGTLIARTTVNWGGDMRAAWQPGLRPDLVAAHRRSLELAVASRSASLRTITTVAQVAAQITLAVTTPLGPLQALGLGWQFVNGVIRPLLDAKR